MENTNSGRQSDSLPAPVGKFYLACGVIICLCAIAEFIIWIIDAGRDHATNLVVMGTGFLSISAGVLWYLLTSRKSSTAAKGGLWVGIIACIALMFIGVAIS